MTQYDNYWKDFENTPQNIHLEFIDDGLTRVSKQDNHLQLDEIDLPVARTVLDFVFMSGMCLAEIEQARDLLKAVEDGRYK